jgi:hypothetical protein
MTSAELVALLDDFALTVRRHVEIVDDPDPETPTVTVEATPGDGQVTVSWSIAPESAAEQVTGWLVGRDGTDTSGAGPWSITDPPEAGSRIFRKLKPGLEYTFTVKALLAGGAIAEGSAKATPKPAGPGPVPPTGRAVPLIGRSGLPVNSIAFTGSSDLAAVEALGRARGRDFDGMLHFTERERSNGSWDQFRSWFKPAHRDWLAAGRLLVTSLPHAPTPKVGGKYTTDALAINARGADDAYAAQQRAFGRWLADAGLNHPLHVLRPDWEFNGNWYAWSAKDPAAFTAALGNFRRNVRDGGATNVLWDVCGNKGPSQAGVDFDAIPADVDILGGDIYDHWLAAKTDAEWAREIARRPGLATLAAEAARRGVMWSVDECGNSHGQQGGGDNPFFWRKLAGFVEENAERCAWICTYNHDGLPATLRHTLQSHNPQSWQVYKDLFGGSR